MRAALVIFSSLVMGGVCIPVAEAQIPQDCSAGPYCVPAIVDDDAPGDPGPGDPNVSDPLEIGSEDHPFDSIQEAIDILLNPCRLILRPGLYHESFQFLGLGCVILGGGEGSTIIESFSTNLGGFELVSYDPSVPIDLTLRDLTLRGGPVDIHGQFFATGDELIRVTLENVVLDGAHTMIWASPADFGDRMVVLARSVDLNESGLLLLSYGTTYSATLESVTLNGGGIGLESYGTEMDAAMSSVAGDGGIGLYRAGGGGQSLTIRDSTIGGITTSSLGYRLRADLENVHFTSGGIVAGEPLLDLSIDHCTFDQGGVSVTARHSPDVGTGVGVSISRSLFRDAGIDFQAHSSSAPFPVVHVASLDVDSTVFLGSGIETSFTANPVYGDLGTELRLLVTNSIFESVPVGAKVSYTMSDPDPQAGHAALSASFVNNTFSECPTGLLVRTNDHVPGQHGATTLIQNNIISGGVRGIEVAGTLDHQITIAHNDIHGQSEAGYAGDVADQTGLNGNISADPLFRDRAAHDFRLTAASPCIDAGGAGAAIPTTDHAGNPRPVDGNLDGTAEPDMGAFEFAPVDEDGDGYLLGEDCDDTDPAINPGAVDLPGNDLDEDCDGETTCDMAAFYKSHGLFIRCVVHECGGLVSAGLVSQAECHDLIAQAAHSDVGRKMRTRKTETPAEP